MEKHVAQDEKWVSVLQDKDRRRRQRQRVAVVGSQVASKAAGWLMMVFKLYDYLH